MSEPIRIDSFLNYSANGALQADMSPAGAQVKGGFDPAPRGAQVKGGFDPAPQGAYNHDELLRAADAEVARAPSSPFADVIRNGNRQIGDGVSVFSGGINVMAALAALVQMQAFGLFDLLSSKTSQSRDSQEMANRVESIRSQLDPNKPDAAAPLSPEIIDYMRKNGITVNGKPIEEFLASTNDGAAKAIVAQASAEVSGQPAQEPDYSTIKLNAGDLAAVKAALESDSGRANDFAQQTQLKMQQMMQQYGLTTQMQTQLLSMINDSIGKIIGNTR